MISKKFGPNFFQVFSSEPLTKTKKKFMSFRREGLMEMTKFDVVAHLCQIWVVSAAPSVFVNQIGCGAWSPRLLVLYIWRGRKKKVNLLVSIRSTFSVG